jgi:hypothetical protein
VNKIWLLFGRCALAQRREHRQRRYAPRQHF